MDEERGEDGQRHLNTQEIQTLFSQCEYLSSVEIFNAQQISNYIELSDMSTPLKLKQLETLAIEIFYLFFVCLERNINPKLHPHFIIFSTMKDRPCLLLNGLFHNQSENLPSESSKHYFIFYSKIVKQIMKTYQASLQKADMEETNPQTMNIPLIFGDNTVPQATKDLAALNELSQECDKVICQMQNDRRSFVEIQKSNFIRSRSVLYRIRNGSLSLMVYRNQKLRKDLQNALREQKVLLNFAREAKTIRRKNHDQLMDLQRRMQANLKKYFSSLKDNPCTLCEEEEEKKSRASKMKFNMKIKPLVEVPFWKTSVEADHICDYIVEYNTMASVVTVKLITNIALEWSNSDLLIYKWNSMCFEAVNFNLEIVEKWEGTKKRKMLGLKCTSELHPTSNSIILKTIKLIEIVTALYKSMDQELKSKSDQEFHSEYVKQMQDSCYRMGHYVNIVSDLTSKLLGSL